MTSTSLCCLQLPLKLVTWRLGITSRTQSLVNIDEYIPSLNLSWEGVGWVPQWKEWTGEARTKGIWRIWLLIYSGLVFADGRMQKIPAWTFMVASIATGTISLIPYLALREVTGYIFARPMQKYVLRVLRSPIALL